MHIKIQSILLVPLINLYQKFVSPRKGFVCAYRKLHNDVSCSEYAKYLIKNHNLLSAVQLFRQRMQQCKQAGIELRRNHIEIGQVCDKLNRKNDSSDNRRDGGCDVTDSCYCFDFFDTISNCF